MSKEVINWLDEERREALSAWVLIEVMSRVGIEKFGEFDASALNVEMKVNGVPVSFKEAMDMLDEQADEWRQRMRKELLSEAKEEILYALRSVVYRGSDDETQED